MLTCIAALLLLLPGTLNARGLMPYDRKFDKPLHVVYVKKQRVNNQDVHPDKYYLAAAAPVNGVIFMGDGAGGTIYSEVDDLGVFTSVAEVCAALPPGVQVWTQNNEWFIDPAFYKELRQPDEAAPAKSAARPFGMKEVMLTIGGGVLLLGGGLLARLAWLNRARLLPRVFSAAAGTSVIGKPFLDFINSNQGRLQFYLTSIRNVCQQIASAPESARKALVEIQQLQLVAINSHARALMNLTETGLRQAQSLARSGVQLRDLQTVAQQLNIELSAETWQLLASYIRNQR